MRQFDSIAEVDSLTHDEALEILQMAADTLQQVMSHGPYGLDDQGDYLNAAIENYHYLFNAYWANDGDPQALHDAVVKWLKDPEWGGSDGEIRHDLFTERWQEEAWEWWTKAHTYWEVAHPEEVRQIRTDNYDGEEFTVVMSDGTTHTRRRLLRDPSTEMTAQYDADMKLTEGKHPDEWPADVRRRIEEVSSK